MACPDFRSRLVLRLSGLQRNSLRDSYLPKNRPDEYYYLLIPSQLRVLRRGKYFFLNSRTGPFAVWSVSGRDCWFFAQNR